MKTRTSVLLLLVLAVISGLLAAGCVTRGISQQSADGIALRFVEDRTKFFIKGEGNATLVENYSFSSAKSYSEGKSWIVVVRVESGSANSTKSANVMVEVDKGSGKVTRLNGAPVKY